MKRLIITTQFPDAVHKLLVYYQLVEDAWQIRATPSVLTYDYPDDALSQEVIFWFALAVGCGLVENWRLDGERKGNPVFIGGNAPSTTIITGHGNIVRKESRH